MIDKSVNQNFINFFNENNFLTVQVGTPNSNEGFKAHDAHSSHRHHDIDGHECFALLAKTEKPDHLKYLQNFRYAPKTIKISPLFYTNHNQKISSG